MRIAESLNEIPRQASTVCLNRRQVGERIAGDGRDEAQAGGAESSKIVHASVVHGEGRGSRNVIEVHSELGVMTSHGQRKVVGDLVALLNALNVGVRLAPKIGKPGDVDRRIRASRYRRVVKVRQTATRILEAQLIHFIVADRPSVLNDAGNIAISLLGRAGISVLPERLVLAADLDPRDRAGTHVSAQRKPIAAADIVVDAQRVQACPLEYGKIPPLRRQRLVRGWHKAWGRAATRRKTPDSGEAAGQSGWPGSIHRHPRRSAD